MRFVSALKHPAELYLIIAGGGYSLSAFVALILNARTLFASTDRIEVKDLRIELGENSVMLIVATAALIAGVGIHQYRLWGLFLAAVLGVLAILESVTASKIDPWEFHNFTIGVPMAAIMIWALLPPTWTMFRQRSVKSS